MEHETIGKWIAAARKSCGWNQEQLGTHLGTSKANVSHWETGKHEASFAQLLKIRDLTGYQLRDVGAAAEWPLPEVSREMITSLSPEQLKALQAGIHGILAAVNAKSTPETPVRKARQANGA